MTKVNCCFIQDKSSLMLLKYKDVLEDFKSYNIGKSVKFL